ncbi:MAG: nitroreductase [Sphaerochaetaceae bacterium]
MGNALEVLMSRRSVRNFQDKQIPQEVLNQILAAGLQAATALGRQSWHFSVVQDPLFIRTISLAVAGVLYDSGIPSLQERSQQKDFNPFHNAPTVVFASSDGSTYSLADCANACQNMTIAATALGIGSCYIGSFVQAFKHASAEELLEKFALPEGYKPIFAVALGYAKKPLPEVKAREWKVSYIR